MERARDSTISAILPIPPSLNAQFTLHDFGPIFNSPAGFDKLPTNARHRRQIGARSHTSDNRIV